MEYTLNEYCKLSFNNPNAPRIVIYPNNTAAANLLNHHISSVSIADCVADDTINLPMPESFMPSLDEKIQEQNKRVVVTGIDAYLLLLSDEKVSAFFTALRRRIDDGKLNTVYLISNRHNLHFINPKYEANLDIITISGDYESIESPKVEVVSDKWVQPGNLTNYKALLKQLGDFLPTGNHTLILKDLRTEQAGLGKNVSFICDARKIAERFYGISVDLPLATIELLLTKVKESSKKPENFLETEFGKENIDVKLALKRLLELHDDGLWMAYVWLLQKQLSADTYLVKVLSSDVTQGNLLRKYVVDTALSFLNDKNAKKFAAERADALRGLTDKDSLVVEFIGQTKDIDAALKFLNCNTDAERIEIVRRASSLDLAVGLPETFKKLYPTLADYLSNEFNYGTRDLNDYFKEYRRFKIINTVTETFVKKAFDFVLPTSFPLRDSMLLDLKTDDAALLVVDGMGAEYLPLLLALAKRRNMNVEFYDIASAKLPTSTTPFNPILWDKDRVLKGIKEVDNIAHNGAVKYEHCPPERNVVEIFRVFETDVFNRIAEGLLNFSRVVVTADHGSSRLAVLAYKEGYCVDLPWNKNQDGEPLDWRYSFAPENGKRSQEFEQQYHPDSEKTYWIVRGYNRLPKSGGKFNELHGGASLEERLVPVVVFTRVKTVQPKQATKTTTEQIVDKMGFDI